MTFSIYCKDGHKRGTAEGENTAARFALGLGYGSVVKYRNRVLWVCDWYDGCVFPDDDVIESIEMEIKEQYHRYIHNWKE